MKTNISQIVKKRRRTRYLVVAAVCLTASVVLGVLLIVFWSTLPNGSSGRKQSEKVSVAASVNSGAEQGADLPVKVRINNGYHREVNLVVKVSAVGLKLEAGRQTTAGLENLSAEELKAAGAVYSSGSGVVWRPGRIKSGANQTITLTTQVDGAAGEQASVKAIAFEATEGGRRCGFFWFKKCDIQVSQTLLGSSDTALLITPQNQATNILALGKGYNLVTLPFVFKGETLNAFWQQFTAPRAWRLDTASNSWLNLLDSANATLIKPGNGFWLYHPDGGAVALPKADAVDVTQKVEVKLKSGWNQIGNPYRERISWDGDKILVQRTGQEDLSLQGAMEAGVITKVLSITGAVPEVGDLTSPTYTEILPGRYLSPFTGLFIESQADATLVFPGKAILAPGELIPVSEKAKILNWINKNSLDLCGNQPSGSTASNPLLNADTGEILDQYDCIILKHPDRPWSK